ncbi:MAG: transcriptional regulator PpsR [Hyphomicrobium sp.]|nr:MAG: transcriptional regulator PpsR [Hyphomicrobium sp.]
MDTQSARAALDLFRAPKKTLGDLDAEAASRLIAAAADIALVIDSKGVIRDVAVGNEDLIKEGYGKWVGQRWLDTVTVESREKIEDLLRDAAGSKDLQRSRQVNHPSKRGPDVPVRYSVVEVSDNGRVVAVGRSLRAIAALQQRLVETHQSMEREYARLRHAETRYRLLFQVASEAVLVVDASSMRIVESNPSATRLLSAAVKRLGGRSFPEIFDADSVKSLQAHLAAVRNVGRAEDVTARLVDTKQAFTVSASLFRQENVSHFLIRLSPVSGVALSHSKSNVFDFVDKLPDGFVVTDLDCRVLKANAAFLELAQIASEEQAASEPLSRWLGRHDVDVKVLASNLKERGSIRNFATIVRGEYGSSEDVEVSAVSVENGEAPCLGFTIRLTGRKAMAVSNGRRELPRSVEQMTELVGRVSLKELVRDTTDIIERLCIEAALELTGDNRASAAEMLGLSRQGLYSKLRRYGLGDLDGDDLED